MTYYKLPYEKLYDLLDKVAAGQKLYVPTDKDGEAVFAAYAPGAQLTKKLNTNRSAKDFFFPQTENLYDIKMKGKQLTVEDTREECEDFTVFGVRGCDARAFAILDKVFLSDPVDTYYKNRREHGTVVTLACNRPEETCFCRAFGIEAGDPEGDATAWRIGDELYLAARTDKGEAFIDSVKDLLEETDGAMIESLKKAAAYVMDQLPLGRLSFEGMKKTDLMTHFKNEKWASLSESCLGCGTCTFVCPTCQCYDIREFDTGKGVKKFRCWDSCMYSDFTLMAHGNSRNSQLERFRQRFMHKLVYFPDNNGGEFGCVGCGRCLAKCPIQTNIVKVEKALEVSADD